MARRTIRKCDRGQRCPHPSERVSILATSDVIMKRHDTTIETSDLVLFYLQLAPDRIRQAANFAKLVEIALPVGRHPSGATFSARGSTRLVN